MDIQLRRQANLEKYRVVMNLGRQSERDDLISVLILAQENGGTVQPNDICTELLAGRQDEVGWRIIRRCEFLGLLEQIKGPTFQLTEQGLKAIEERRVFLPERGTYDILCAIDPLLPQKLLSVEIAPSERLHELIESQRASQREGEEKDLFEAVSKVPEWIHEFEGIIFDLLGKNKYRIRIESTEFLCLPLSLATNERLNVILTISQNQSPVLQLSGLFDQKIPCQIPLAHEKIWLALLGDRAEDWTLAGDSYKLNCVFDELSAKERNSFQRNMTFSNPHVPDLGEFENTTISAIPITAKDLSEANLWAYWLLAANIPGYMNSQDYHAYTQEITLKFPEFSIEFPTQETLAQELHNLPDDDGRFPTAFWHLQAPLDLRLE